VVRTLLVRGMLAGLAAAVVAFVVAVVLGEPSVDSAIAYEEAAGAGHDHGGGVELVSRAVQAGPGLFVGLVVYGVAVGGLFALVFAALAGRVGPTRPRAAALALAAIGFAVVTLTPFLKYPANPPASTEDGTIGQRTGLYLVMLLFALVLAGLATAAGRSLAPRWGAWNATVAAVAGYAVVATAVGALLPSVAETPADFPATVLYDFRIASLAVQATVWAVLGVVFGALVERTARERVSAR
jgi:predicted cobalt transporter CbtA